VWLLPGAGFALFTQALGPIIDAAGDALRGVGEEARSIASVNARWFHCQKKTTTWKGIQAGALALLTRLQLGGNLL
jgi:hypothetical protein